MAEPFCLTKSNRGNRTYICFTYQTWDFDFVLGFLYFFPSWVSLWPSFMLSYCVLQRLYPCLFSWKTIRLLIAFWRKPTLNVCTEWMFDVWGCLCILFWQKTVMMLECSLSVTCWTWALFLPLVSVVLSFTTAKLSKFPVQILTGDKLESKILEILNIKRRNYIGETK